MTGALLAALAGAGCAGNAGTELASHPALAPEPWLRDCLERAGALVLPAATPSASHRRAARASWDRFAAASRARCLELEPNVYECSSPTAAERRLERELLLSCVHADWRAAACHLELAWSFPEDEAAESHALMAARLARDDRSRHMACSYFARGGELGPATAVSPQRLD